jgi:hypothetical protein
MTEISLESPRREPAKRLSTRRTEQKRRAHTEGGHGEPPGE